MLKLSVIGNLGADAEVKSENGKQFVAFSIAHTDSVRKADGSTEEKTQWISATLNGDGGRLLPYLKKGAKVHVTGDCTTRQYHSEKQRAFVAGLKVFVRDLELISTTTEDVPHTLYDVDSVAYSISKHYYCPSAAGLVLYSRAGAEFHVSNDGWVTPAVESQESHE